LQRAEALERYAHEASSQIRHGKAATRAERGKLILTRLGRVAAQVLPLTEWTEVLGSERLTGTLLDRLTHHAHKVEMNGERSQLKPASQTQLAARPITLDRDAEDFQTAPRNHRLRLA
jgi:hypothetical protein